MSKILEDRPWPAVVEIIVAYSVVLTFIIFQSRQSDLQAVAVSPSTKHSPESGVTSFGEKQEEAS